MGNRAFKSHDGHYLSAEGHHIKGHHNHHDHHTHFHVENHGDKIALRTHCGKYVSIGDNKEVYLSDHFHGSHSVFSLDPHHGKVAIRGHHHHYIGFHNGNVRSHHERSNQELFEEIIV